MRVEAQTKGERKSRKGGRSLVLVLTDISLSFFSVLFVLLFGKPFLSFIYFFLSLRRIAFCQRDF
jgi:hypothetical protein